MELEVDEGRIDDYASASGIFVRAKRGAAYGNYDIATLTPKSLHLWLRSRGGNNEWAENALALVLGYDTPLNHGE